MAGESSPVVSSRLRNVYAGKFVKESQPAAPELLGSMDLDTSFKGEHYNSTVLAQHCCHELRQAKTE